MEKPSFQAYLSNVDVKGLIKLMKNANQSDLIPVMKIHNSGVLDKGSEMDPAKLLALLLSDAASQFIEPMALKARALSLQHFGYAISLYTPLYVSNFCINGCKYCSYGAGHTILRRALTLNEIELEAHEILKTGLKHLLLLIGESEQHFNFECICESVDMLMEVFDSVSLEGYALLTEEYRQLAQKGLYGVTLYQETYDAERYARLHPYGPKADYAYRLDAPERIGQAGLRAINIGVLMGLSDWQVDVLHLGLHGLYLSKYYPEMELSLSLPRLKSFEGSDFNALGIHEISDRQYVQAMLALRWALPFASQNVSTRESQRMRMDLIPLGVNKMSAGVSTSVGGRTLDTAGDGQFDIADYSSVEDVKAMIYKAGYQPIMRDWISFN